MGIIFTIAWHNLLQSGRRTFFLALALALVTTFMVVMLALTQGIKTTLRETATTLQTGHVNVGGFTKPSSGRSLPVLPDRDKLISIVEQNVEGLDYYVARRRGFGKLIGVSGSTISAMNGVDITKERRLRATLQLAAESEYRPGGSSQKLGSLDDLAKTDSIVLFAKTATRLGVTVGDSVTITSETMRGVNNTVDLKVVAVVKDFGFMSDWNAYVHWSAIERLYSLPPGGTGAIHIYLKDMSRSTEVMGKLLEAYKKAGYEVLEHQSKPFFAKFDELNGEDWVGVRLDLTIWEDEIAFLLLIITGLEYVIRILLYILTTLIAFGIVNAMQIAVRERTNEIGTLRAIGMSRFRVLAMFQIEGFLLGLFATTAGALFGATLSVVVTAMNIEVTNAAFRTILMSDHIRLLSSPLELVTAIGAFTTVTALAAFWPSYQASRMQPVTAMHSSA